MTTSDKKLRFCYFLLIPVILFFHFDLIRTDSLLMRDDFMLINPVAQTTSIFDYFRNLFAGVYSDLQPIRDLSFYFNIKIHQFFGYGGFHLMNILLGGLILVLSRRILKFLNLSEFCIFVGIVFVACHPVFNSSLAWVSNRKHLLSFVFMLLFALENFKQDGKGWKSFLWAALSFLSQPITIFIPPLVVLYKKQFKKWDIAVILLSMFIFVLNVWFYKSQTQFVGRDFINSFNSELGNYILKFFRVSMQILFPVKLAMEYDLGSPFNFYGIFLSILFLYIVIKVTQPKKHLLIYLIICSTLFPVVSWGVKDAYLIPTLLLCGYLLAKSNNKILYYLCIPYFIFLGFYSVKFTSMWQNDLSLTETSYEVEGGAMNMGLYAHQLAKKDPAKAYEYYSEVFKAYPDMTNPPLQAERAKALFKSKRSNEDKLIVFQKEKTPDVFMLFYEAKLLSEMGKVEKSENAFKALSEVLRNPDAAKIFITLICEDVENSVDCKKVLEDL